MFVRMTQRRHSVAPEPHARHARYLAHVAQDLLKRILQVYVALTRSELLLRCWKKRTPNPNESLHSKLWLRCFKVKNAHLSRVTFAATDTVLIHNFGYEDSSLLVRLGLGLQEPKRNPDLKGTPTRRTPKRFRVQPVEDAAAYAPGIPARPRHLVAIINPFGGKKTCAAIYEHHAAPLLRRAAIAVTVSTTTHSGHAEFIAEEAAGTPGVNGVLVVGGDGIVAEAANGLIKYAVKVQGAKLNDRTASLPKTSIKLGVIPGGSTNAFFMSLQGTESPVTATLQVIMGCNLHVDVGAVYVEDRLLQFTVCGLHVGFLGALLETSVKLRTLGPIRDVIGATKEILRNRSYSCTMRFLEPAKQRSSPYDDIVCSADCRVCSASETDNESGVWTERNGDYHLIMIPLQSLECRYCKYGVSPACHSGDGTADLLLVPKSSMVNIVSDKLSLVHFRDHLKRTSLEAFRSSEIHCKMDPSVPINLDGELRYLPNFVMRVHRQRLAVFCRGREPVSSLDLSRASNNF
ncbi:Diacylglycerol kinase catalytic domain [Trinorchestia longiramus]|nr:Diacylglycerol kinase catalytic domain [Trinorchestia longiramus]